MEKRFFHYTSKLRIEEIIDSKKIKLATAGIEKKERPAVWFSSNPIWEHTVTKLAIDGNGNRVQLTFDEMVENFGLARIEIEPTFELINWDKFKDVSNISKAGASILEKVGKAKGANPSEWYVSFNLVSINYWIRAEIWENGKWIEFDVFE